MSYADAVEQLLDMANMEVNLFGSQTIQTCPWAED
jgi:hypothetical protein